MLPARCSKPACMNMAVKMLRRLPKSVGAARKLDGMNANWYSCEPPGPAPASHCQANTATFARISRVLTRGKRRGLISSRMGIMVWSHRYLSGGDWCIKYTIKGQLRRPIDELTTIKASGQKHEFPGFTNERNGG